LTDSSFTGPGGCNSLNQNVSENRRSRSPHL
jgi:hypothetical protein